MYNTTLYALQFFEHYLWLGWGEGRAEGGGRGQCRQRIFLSQEIMQRWYTILSQCTLFKQKNLQNAKHALSLTEGHE